MTGTPNHSGCNIWDDFVKHSMTVRLLASLAVCLCLLLLTLALPTRAGEVAIPDKERSEDTLILGKVTNNPKKHYGRLMVMGKYLVGHLRDLGITRAEVRLARTQQEMVAMLREGKVDLVTETAYGAITFMDQAAAEPLLLKWKKGVRDYRSLIVVRKDSGIESLADLKGRVVAFEDKGSTSAYLIPRVVLQNSGMVMTELLSPRAKPLQEHVGYVFSQSEQNTAAWVYKGLVDAGAISDLDWNKSDHVLLRQKDKLKIIYQSKPIPRAFELVQAGLAPDVKARIRQTLLNAHNDPLAANAMKQYQKVTKFEEIDQNVMEALQEIREQASALSGITEQ